MAAHSLASAFASAKKTSEELVWDGDDDESGDDEDGLRETLVRMSLAAQQETQASHVTFAAEATGLTPRSGSSSGTSFFAEPVPAAPSPDGHLSLVLAELLETERRFKSRCEILVEYFQRPFERWVLECADASPTRQRRRSSGVDDAEGSPTLDDARTLFGNAAEVLAWSKAFVGELESCFADAVEQRADVWSTAARVGAVRRPTSAARLFENESFVGAVVFAAADRDMKAVFAAYSRNRDDSRKKHAALPAAARTFLRALELHPLARNLPLESYLMEPVQRIPRAAASPHGRAILA